MKITGSGIHILVLLCACFPGLRADEPVKVPACEFRVPEAEKLIVAKKLDEATETILKPAVAQLAQLRTKDGRQFYCSRTDAETLFYMLGAAAGVDVRNGQKSEQTQSAVIVDFNFALAHYYLAYIDIEKKDLAGAEANLNEALKLSPANPLFLAEMGHIYQTKREWEKSTEFYDKAFSYTEANSPDSAKLLEKGRCLRGKAYALVELRQFENALALYQECLALNPNDRRAKAEIKYIEDLQAKAAAK